MAHKSPFTDWVYDAWDQLVLDKGAKLSFAERYAGWRALYERCYIDGKWTIPIHDAELVATLGCSLGWEAGDFTVARVRTRELLDHPDFSQIPAWLALEHQLKEAVARYLCGETEAALARLGDLSTRRLPRDLVLIRGNLCILLEAIGPNHVPEEGLVDLVVNVVAAHRGRKRLAESVRDAKTATELQDALRRCYPRPNGPITR